MNTRQRENSKLKCFKHFILGHKKGKMFLTGKNQISFIFCFYKTKENILLQIQPLKMLNKHFLCADFRVTVKIFEALRQAKKQHFKGKLWKWGPITIWHNMNCVQFFFKITPPYCTVVEYVDCVVIDYADTVSCCIDYADTVSCSIDYADTVSWALTTQTLCHVALTTQSCIGM